MITFTITTFLLTALIIGFWYLYSKNSSDNTTKSTSVDLYVKLEEPNETHQEDSAVITNEFNRDIKKYKPKKPVVKDPIIKEKNQFFCASRKNSLLMRWQCTKFKFPDIY